MTNYPIWYDVVAGILGGILGIPFGLWLHRNCRPQMEKILDKLLGRFGL